MGMTIDKSLANLKTLQADYQQFHNDVWQDPESYGIIAESLQVAIDTMRKYQRIDGIYYSWNTDKHAYYALKEIGEVLENGIDDIKC